MFDIPRDVCFLNAAAWSPLPLATVEAGRKAVARKAQPWKIDARFAGEQHDRARRAAAALINAAPDDVALISSVAYGVATAAKALPVARGTRVLVLEEDHSSPVLEWTARADAQGFTVETVRRPGDGDWTSAVLEAIERRGAAPVALASISSVHWTDGIALDMPCIAAALRARGAALLVDATQAVGAMPVDVGAFDPDFLVFPTYKWTLGPYGRAFLYIARRRQEAVPLEQTAFGRKGVAAERLPYFADTSYVAGARRFDMGERDHFIGLEMASIGMELAAAWGTAAVAGRIKTVTDRLAEGLRNSGVLVADDRFRCAHILSLGFPKGVPEDLPQRLAAEDVHVALRLGKLRVSPHVYNDNEDADRFLEVFLKHVN